LQIIVPQLPALGSGLRCEASCAARQLPRFRLVSFRACLLRLIDGFPRLFDCLTELSLILTCLPVLLAPAWPRFIGRLFLVWFVL
jgi:hypothetical protein